MSFVPRPLEDEAIMDESRLITITRPSDGQSLCRTCYWAHAQKGYRQSEEAVFCAFSFELRRVSFQVRDCTDYLNRNLPTRKQMEEIALIIPSEPRKPAGFTGMGFVADADAEDEEGAAKME